jgi:hypothetical protein
MVDMANLPIIAIAPANHMEDIIHKEVIHHIISTLVIIAIMVIMGVGIMGMADPLISTVSPAINTVNLLRG